MNLLWFKNIHKEISRTITNLETGNVIQEKLKHLNFPRLPPFKAIAETVIVHQIRITSLKERQLKKIKPHRFNTCSYQVLNTMKCFFPKKKIRFEERIREP